MPWGLTVVASCDLRRCVEDGYGLAWEHFEHVADIGIRGTGATLEEAFEQAALALTAIVTDPASVKPERAIQIRRTESDIELLFADWINALVYEIATRGMLFSQFDVAITQEGLTATVWGEAIDPARHQPAVEIKGATYTCLRVARARNGDWVAECVVDV
ncbi:MAG: archease [Pseudomonadota bacterium]|nr:archease [Pseudomonadota bacterium]